jgi:hypothetical protein
VARNVAVIIGSLRKASINRKLALALVKLAPSDLACDFMAIDDLPVYSQEHDQSPPQQVVRVKAQIEKANAFLGAFDRILAYDFDAFISGHTAEIGRRKDIEITKKYAFDVYETVKRVHSEINVAELLARNRDNEQAGIKALIDKVTATAAADVKSRWLNGPMKGVDIWTESHCRAMLLYVRWSD